jgi:hypothetical protein
LLFFLLSSFVLLSGCGSGKELLLGRPDRLKAVRTIAVIGFPGQCTYEREEHSFLTIALERFGRIARFQIAPPERTLGMASHLGIPAIYPNDEYSTLDLRGVADLCTELEVDAVIVGFYRNRIVDTEPTTYVNESGQTVTTSSPTYAKNYPVFEVCIVGADGSLLFRAVAEGRKTGFWSVFWDSLFKSESDETFYARVQDALDGICDMLGDQL